MHAKSLQSCPTLCNPMDCSPPGSPIHRILQARILEWAPMPLSRGIFPTWESKLCPLCLLHWQMGSLPLVPLGKPLLNNKLPQNRTSLVAQGAQSLVRELRSQRTFGAAKKKKKNYPRTTTSYSLMVSADQEPGHNVAKCLWLKISEEMPSNCHFKMQLGLEIPLPSSLKGLLAGGLISSLWASP